MRTLFFSVATVAAMMLSLAGNAFIVRVEVTPNFGYWTNSVNMFKQFLEHGLPDVDRRLGEGIHGIPFSPNVKHDGVYDYKKLTVEDWRALATTYNGIDQFNLTCGIKDIAGAKGPVGEFTQKDIEDAQVALEYLKPDSCADWMAFGRMLHKLQKETEAERAPIMARKRNARSAAH